MRHKKVPLLTLALAATVIATISRFQIFKKIPGFCQSRDSGVRYYSEKSFPRSSMSHEYSNFKEPFNFSVDEFYLTDLIQNPEQANKLSRLLTTRKEVILEAQRVHMHIFGSLLSRYKYAMLFDYSPSENKGDSAIAVGEVILLRKLNIEVIFACPTGTCIGDTIKEAVQISKLYSSNDLVILFHGGGNVIGFHAEDKRRFSEIGRFKMFHIVMFPQSILYRGKQDHIDLCKKMYASHERLTFVWRDNVSYWKGKELFPNVQSLLSPDIAYQIGHVERFMPPSYDILWIRRDDNESPRYKAPPAQKDYRIRVADWLHWDTPKGTSPMEDVFLMTTNGLTFLQRGRVVITDRLHGHILSTLLDIPHVYIDNTQRKISNYHNTWTAGIENIVLANSSADALVLARKLLVDLDDLPNIPGFYTK